MAGRLPEARQEVERTLEVARPRWELELVSSALALLPRLADLAGEGEDTLGPAEEAARISADSGNLLFHVLALEAVGVARLVLGQWDEAIAAFDRAISHAHVQAHSTMQDASMYAYLARAHLALGDQGTARQHADDAVAVAQDQGAKCFGMRRPARPGPGPVGGG